MRGSHHEKSFENPKQPFGKNTPSRTQIFFLFDKVRRGRQSFNDEHQCGTPATVVRVPNFEAEENFIRFEPRVTTGEIQESLSIGMAATMSILHNHLGVRKRCARWIPHSLTEEQRWIGVEWCKFMLRKFNGGHSELTWEVLTGDET